MSKAVISSLIDEINLLLSRPVGSVSRRVSPDTIYQREQLKQLRSHLENLTDDSYLGNLEQQYQDLVMRLQSRNDSQHNQGINQSPTQVKTDKLETSPSLLVSPTSNVFSAEPDLFKETSTMTNATPDPNPTFINERMIASLQQAIQQTLQQVVKESVQQSVQQVVSQTLAVERALMVGEISASLNQSINQSINQSLNQGLTKIAEAQQRSQISQELASLNQQKQKLSDEIARLESDRTNWMQQFQEFQNSQQESMNRSLQSVNQYVREQIVDTVHQTVQQAAQQAAQQNKIETTGSTHDAEFASHVQAQSDRFLAHLDEMFNSTFKSLEQDIQEYQNAIATKISYMETLEQKGEALINALTERMSQQNEVPTISAPTVQLPELPADIPARYLETVPEPADESLISALLAGNEFGETIVAEDIETIIEPRPEVVLPNLKPKPELGDRSNIEVEQNPESMIESIIEPIIEQRVDANIQAIATPADSLSIETLLDAPSDSLFEETDDADLNAQITEAGQEIYFVDNAINPDFDLDAPTQLVENFGLYDEVQQVNVLDAGSLEKQEQSQEVIDDLEIGQLDLESSVSDQQPINDELTARDEDPELLEWLDESSNRPTPTNLAEISPDEELLSWLGNDAIDMAKLPIEPKSTETANNISIINDPIAELLVSPSPSTATNITNKTKSDINSDRETNQPAQASIIKSEKAIEHVNAPFFREFISDQADDSDESLILFANDFEQDDADSSDWGDSLFNELNSDLEQLDAGKGIDPLIAANIDQFIRNTPYSGTNYLEVDLSLEPPTSEVMAQTINGDRPTIDAQAGDALDSQPVTASPIEPVLGQVDQIDKIEVPPIIENPDVLFLNELNEAFDDESSDSYNQNPVEENIASLSIAVDDEMDAIFADVIADNIAKQTQADPFETGDELDLLFKGDADANLAILESSPEATDTVVAPLEQFIANANDLFADNSANTILELGLTREPIAIVDNDLEINFDSESELETLLFGFDPATEIENYQSSNTANTSNPQVISKDTFMQTVPDDDYQDLDLEADTLKDMFSFDDPAKESVERSDTNIQGLNAEPTPETSADITSFVTMEDMATVLESSFEPVTVSPIVEDDWTAALEQLEARLSEEQNSLKMSSQVTPVTQVSELSADEFFASLEQEKLSDFADKSGIADRNLAAIANDIENSDSDLDVDDLLLNQFADAQPNAAMGSDRSDWDSLLNELDTFSFNQPLLDDRRQQMGLSAVAPISDISENVLDIDSLVIETQRDPLIPAPTVPEVYSLDDTWILGIDFGSVAVRASLFNANTNKVYALSLDDCEELSCQLAWATGQQVDDPIAANMRVITKKSKNFELETGEIAINQFKQFLKIGLPYRGVSAWQPIIQWSDQQQLNLRWLVGALKTLLEQIQTRANHGKLPDLGLILLNLSGVVFGYPDHWSDAYILNVREAIVKAGLIKQPEQVLAVEQAIAPILSLIHNQKLANQITLLMDAGALTTSICLVKGAVNPQERLDATKIQVHSIDYAGNGINQDIVIHLFYPHWQLITNPHRHLCNLEHLSLPEVGAPASELRILLQQYLCGFELGRHMLEFADRVKIAFSEDPSREQWNDELMGHPLLVMRRELENLILQPFIKRLNRELNNVLSNAGLLGEDVAQILLLGGTIAMPSLSRWLSQKLPNAQIESLPKTAIADGLAVAPLYSQMYNVARQQYSDYFLLQEICRLNLTKSINPTQLLKQLQMRGVNIKACRDRLLTILQGDLPDGLFPWQEPEQGVILEDPTLSNDLLAGRLFELETDGTYQPNVVKFQQLRIYLQAVISNMSQSLNEPLVFPEILAIANQK